MLCLFLLIALSSFFFNNLTEYNWEHPLFQVLFYFLTSTVFIIKRFLNPKAKEISFQLTMPYKMAISGLLIMVWVGYVGSPWVGNYYLSKAGKLLLKNDERAIHYLLKASSFDRSNPTPYLVLSQINKNAWSNTKRELFFENAVTSQKMAIHSSPMQAHLYLDLAKLYEDAKWIDETEFYYKKAIEINPNTSEYKYVFALFLARSGQTEKAIAQWENLKVFLEKYEPKGILLMTVYLNLSEAYKKIQNFEGAKTYLDSVVRFPEDLINKEPSDAILKYNFISNKKKAADELTNLMKTNTP
jgi:tetratricopeptide (TPR) repeat protein